MDLAPLAPEVEDILKLLSGLFWSLAYVLIIVRGFKDNTFGMPVVALCANIAWEFTFSLVYPRDPPQLYINFVWFFLDVIILYQVIRYAREEFRDRLPMRFFYPALAAGLLISFLIIVGMAFEFDSWNGHYAAFGQNLMMSVLFVFMFFGRNGVRGQSIYVAIFKLIGTLLPSILFFFRDPASLLLNTLYVSIFAFDLLYVGLLHAKFKQLNISPWRRA